MKNMFRLLNNHRHVHIYPPAQVSRCISHCFSCVSCVPVLSSDIQCNTAQLATQRYIYVKILIQFQYALCSGTQCNTAQLSTQRYTYVKILIQFQYVLLFYPFIYFIAYIVSSCCRIPGKGPLKPGSATSGHGL
jgi:hypothetical protein